MSAHYVINIHSKTCFSIMNDWLIDAQLLKSQGH